MKKIVIIGGGAAGFFTAINAAEFATQSNQKVNIKILEAGSQVLKKVRISGGGRCNVTHNLFDTRAFSERYPRGRKELLSPFKRFQALDTIEWFRSRGVNLVAEADGRMFPDTNSSQTIIDCFLKSAEKAGVELLTNHKVERIEKTNSGQFQIYLNQTNPLVVDQVMIATGSTPLGHSLAKGLGHTITELAPSLFSFKIEDPLIHDLPGLSFESSNLQLIINDRQVFTETGPLLITHWGLSGPAILKISAWAARDMQAANYQARLKVNWLGLPQKEQVINILIQTKENGKKSQIQNVYPDVLAHRFWIKVLEKTQTPFDLRWADLSNKQLNAIADILYASELKVLGKNRYKDEFVECGGVALTEIDFKTMQSKICPGLYFAGEVLDIDGLTGGFNFQNSWTGGWIAAQSLCTMGPMGIKSI